MAQAELASETVNTPVGEETTTEISVNPGGNVDFDALEAITDRMEKQKPAKKKEEDDGGDRSTSKEKSGEREEEETPIEKEETPYEAKLLKVKVKDQEADYDLNAHIPVKIKGEDVNVPLQELVNNYSGKVVYEKKFQELSSDKKDFSQKVKSLDNHINYIFDMAQGIDKSENPTLQAVKVLRLIGNLAGKDAVEMTKGIRKAFLNEAQYRSQLSREENDNLDLREELEYNKLDRDSQKKLEEAQKMETELLHATYDIQDKFGLDETEYDKIYSILSKTDLAKDGRVNPSQVAEYSRGVMAHQAILEFDQNKVSDNNLFNFLVETAMDNPSYKKEDLIAMMREALGEQPKKERDSAKNLSRKLANTSQATPKKLAAKTEPLFFSDLWV